MKTKLSIGTGLWLVEGTTKWALYDLLNGTIIQLTKDAGEILVKLFKDKRLPQEKRNTIIHEASDFYQILQSESCFECLFEKPTKLPSDCRNYMLWVEVTNTCNQQCLDCYTRSNIERKDFLAKETLIKIVNQASKLRFEQIQFTGGEPLLHPKLWEAIRKVRNIGVIPIVEIYTNLTLLKEEDIKLLKRYKVKIATTLLGSSSIVHDYCTGCPGSFETFMRNIRKIRDNKIEFRVGVIRLPENKSNMQAVKELMQKEGLVSLKSSFSPDDVRPIGRGKRYLNKCREQEKELYLHINNEYFHLSQQWNTCWGGELAITSTGKVLPCIFARDLVLGNIYQQSLEYIINSPKTQRLWKITSDKIEKCKECEFRYACMDCRVLSIKAGRGLFGAPVRCGYNPCQ